jgi:CRISPR-associated endonuclease Cas1
MAATKTLPQLTQPHNLQVSRPGVLTLYGYGIQIRIDRGHLLIEDGIAGDRRRARIPRVGHGLKRLVIIGSDGIVSLAALRWLADQETAFVMLERNGKILLNTGPTHSSDARLRRAQALSSQSGTALQIAREIINKKLAGQERVARSNLLTTKTAETILRYRQELTWADSPERIRLIESHAAGAYWGAWRTLPITFPRKDEPRVPAHWRVFGARVSPLTGSPRLAVNPPNAILNYLYAVLESESRLAAAALGLDPGIGVLHVDTPARDSLACDLMEVVRPQVDAFLLDWITRETLKREWFLEQRDGNCRLMAQLAIKLSETAPTWARAVAPIAEWVAGMFWARGRRTTGAVPLPTRLTQRHKREAKGASPLPPPISPPRRETFCRECGKTIQVGSVNCADCAICGATERLVNAARLGRVAARNPESRAKHRVSRRRHAQACSEWDPSTQPKWLTGEVFSQRIQPMLANVSNSAIRSILGVSRCYAGKIRQGYRPHPRHWEALAELVGASANARYPTSGLACKTIGELTRSPASAPPLLVSGRSLPNRMPTRR